MKAGCIARTRQLTSQACRKGTPVRAVVSHRRTTSRSIRIAIVVGASVVALAGGLAIAPVVLAKTAATVSLYPNRTVAPGQPTTVTGSAYVAGRPAAGKGAALQYQVSGSKWATFRVVRLNSQGYFRFPVRAYRSTNWRLVVGDATIATTASKWIYIKVQDRGAAVVAEASRHAGKPYRWGAAGPNAFDCSGYTLYVYGRFGKRLPHRATLQASHGTGVAAAAKRPGDLILYGRPGNFYHAAIYAGGGYMWDSSTSGKPVAKRRMYSGSYVVRRLV